MLTFITEKERLELAEAGKSAAFEILDGVINDQNIESGKANRCSMRAYKACCEAIINSGKQYRHRYVLLQNRVSRENAKSSDTPSEAFIYQIDDDIDHAFASAYYQAAFGDFVDSVSALSEAGARLLPMIEAAKAFGCLSMADSAIALASDGEGIRPVTSAGGGDLLND